MQSIITGLGIVVAAWALSAGFGVGVGKIYKNYNSSHVAVEQQENTNEH